MKRLFLIVVFSVFGLCVLAQPAMPFMEIDRNPSTLSMGGTNVGSQFYNPAASALSGSAAMISFQSWSPSAAPANHLNLFGSAKIDQKLGILLSGAYQLGNSYTPINSSGVSSDPFSPSELLLGLGAGYAITELLSVGATVKFARQVMEAASSNNGMAIDVMAMYHLGALNIAGGVTSLGPAIKGKKASWPLPTAVKAGVDYFLSIGVLLSAQADVYLSSGLGLSVGAQYSYKDFLFARAGYHLGTGKAPVPSFASVGLGACFARFSVDISFLTASDVLGNTLSLGVSYSLKK